MLHTYLLEGVILRLSYAKYMIYNCDRGFGTFPATTARLWPDLADGRTWRCTVGGSEYASAACQCTPGKRRDTFSGHSRLLSGWRVGHVRHQRRAKSMQPKQ